MKQVALFSIPGCVSFPYSTVPLHVFEPRYREMVKYCLENEVLMGVCHVQKVLHQAKPDQTLQETLKSNQSTYKPHNVFSIGKVELLDTFADGRMKIVVAMSERARLEREVQTLPFSLVDTSPINDSPSNDDEPEQSGILKEKIIRRMLALTADNPQAVEYLSSEKVKQMPIDEFSYRVFSMIQLDPDLLQQVLEMTSPNQRMTNFLRILNS